MPTIFATRLRELREGIGKTQEEMAERVDVRRQTYNAYEHGKIMPKAETLLKLSQIFNTTPNYLLGFDSKRFKDMDSKIEEEERRSSMIATGGILRRLREEKRLTLLEVAQEFNIPLKTLTAYEEGKKEIPDDVLKEFAKYFNVDVENIIAIEVESLRKHAVITTSETISNRYKMWMNEVGYAHFTDEEVEELITFAKYLKYKRQFKGGGVQ